VGSDSATPHRRRLILVAQKYAMVVKGLNLWVGLKLRSTFPHVDPQSALLDCK
jgi:hypothetical protein